MKKHTLLCSLIFTATLPLGSAFAGTLEAVEEAPIASNLPLDLERGRLDDPRFSIHGGYDSKRYYRGFTLTDDPWFWGGAELFAWPFNIYYGHGDSDGFEEINTGLGLFFGNQDGLHLRFGYELDHFGKDDFFLDNNHNFIGAAYLGTPIGRVCLFDYVYETEFGGSLMRIGFLSKPLLVNEHLGFVFETNLRYNDEFYGNPESGFNNLEFFLYAPVFLNRNARIIPFVRYNEAFEATDFFQDSEFTGGVTLQVVF